MEKITVFVVILSIASFEATIVPYNCPGNALLSNGEGRCLRSLGDNVLVLGTPVTFIFSLGLAFSATEMANKTLRKRVRELKDERRQNSLHGTIQRVDAEGSEDNDH